MADRVSKTTPPLGIPQDEAMPPCLSPEARELFRALRSLNKHGDPDQMMRDLEDWGMADPAAPSSASPMSACAWCSADYDALAERLRAAGWAVTAPGLGGTS